MAQISLSGLAEVYRRIRLARLFGPLPRTREVKAEISDDAAVRKRPKEKPRD